MMFGSYRTVYGGRQRMVQQPDGSYRSVANPWVLEPGTSMAHKLKLRPAKVHPAGQASDGSGVSPVVVLGVVGIGLIGLELIRYSLRKYAR